MILFDVLAVAGAVADPRRLRALVLLEGRSLTVSELADAVDVVDSVASYHVRKLEAAGLVVTTRRGRNTYVRRREGPWRRVLDAFVTP